MVDNWFCITDSYLQFREDQLSKTENKYFGGISSFFSIFDLVVAITDTIYWS